MSLWIKSWSVTIQVQAIEQYFPVGLFIERYKLVLTYESVDKIMKCHHSSTNYWAVLSWLNKQSHRKVLLNSLYLNGDTSWFYPQTHKLEPVCTAQ